MPYRQEYPRPDFQREDWINLNGQWDFAFDDNNAGISQRWELDFPNGRKIEVPFCYQSELSGIAEHETHPVLWYHREFTVPQSFSGKRVLLHFGAVDYNCDVYLNGRMIGSHSGGYTPFHFSVETYLVPGTNHLTLRVEDRPDCSQPRGKQYWKEQADRCWYEACSGIWQTVWMETVGENYIRNVRILPDIDRKEIRLEVTLDAEPAQRLILTSEITFDGRPVSIHSQSLQRRRTVLTIALEEKDFIDEQHYWWPHAPHLFDVKFSLMQGESCLDQVNSYFGMRKISIRDGYILLNNMPYYQKLILDQGYWEDGMMTAPSDEALRKDVELTKQLGFNGARKHQKVEDPRYYYWADKLGLLVWGELPSAYEFGPDEMQMQMNQMQEFILRDSNHPCIIAWVPLNESWGVRNIVADRNQQNYAAALYHMIKALDSTRFISNNDGWEQVSQTDIYGIHDYRPYGDKFGEDYADIARIFATTPAARLLLSDGQKLENKPILVTEFGGIALQNGKGEFWGYNGLEKNEESFLLRFGSLIRGLRSIPYLQGYCYTQLTDVYQEQNGLLNFDRTFKISPEKVAEIVQGT
ncbi:MAG: glycoside hydrolase family 2 [Ruminococcaceae bacterium]|nr:glycoside hydrolase family 2 [Oscillospiraceae bacterium]